MQHVTLWLAAGEKVEEALLEHCHLHSTFLHCACLCLVALTFETFLRLSVLTRQSSCLKCLHGSYVLLQVVLGEFYALQGLFCVL